MKGGVFVTGTDTGVGKTCVTLALMHAFRLQGERVAGMKPVSSGCEAVAEGLRNADALQLQHAASDALPYQRVNPYAFAPPIAPHIAAAADGIAVDSAVILDAFAALRKQADRVVVEGVGGWCVPLGDGLSMEDIAVALGLPVVLVVGIRLGCLNHALLTERAIRGRGVRLAGWVANRVDPACAVQDDNVAALRHRIAAPLLADIEFQEGGCDAARLAPLFDMQPLMSSPACA